MQIFKFILLISTVFVFNCFSNSYKNGYSSAREYMIESARKTNPKLYSKLESIQKEVRDRKYVIFLFASSNLDTNRIERFVLSGNKYIEHFDLIVIYKELNKRILNRIISMNDKLDKKNVTYIPDTIYDPKFFRENGLDVSPVMFLSVCQNNKRPEKCDNLFKIYGTTDIGFFLKKVVEYDKSFEYLLNGE